MTLAVEAGLIRTNLHEFESEHPEKRQSGFKKLQGLTLSVQKENFMPAQ
ncbi:hypothetical protein [Methanosarcina siciliae]|nr:hypothetical protein [Methanosarcina siciliae]